MNDLIVSDQEIKGILTMLDDKLEYCEELNPFILRVLKNAKSKLEILPRLRAIQKFKLVFIGKQGCGKTTCIANLAQLLNSKLFCDELEEKPCDLEKASLLTTGSGGTTAPEVYINQVSENEDSKIIIYCSNIAQVKDLVKAYVNKEYIKLAQVKDEDDEDGEDYSSLNREHGRILEGMCYNIIKEHESIFKEKFKNEKKGFSWLPLIIRDEIIKQKDTDSVKNIIENISNLIIEKYMCIDTTNQDTEPKELEIIYKNDKPFKKWISDTFDSINRGTYPGLLIPREVHIYISTTHLDMKLKSIQYDFSSIIDTRGYRSSDKNSNGEVIYAGDGIRHDFEKYLKYEANNIMDTGNICILTDRYINLTEGHSSVLNEIILNHISLSDSNQIGLNTMLVNWKKGEPKSSADANERRDDEMIKYRIEEIKDFYVENKGYLFNENNVLDYNPLVGYRLDADEIIGYNVTKAKEAKNIFINELEEIVNNEKARLNKEISASYECIQQFVANDSFQLGNNADAIIQELSIKVNTIMNILAEEFDRLDFALGYENKLKNFGSRSYKPLALKDGIHCRVDGARCSVFDIPEEIIKSNYQILINEAGIMIKSEIETSIEVCKQAVDGQALANSLCVLESEIDNIFKTLEVTNLKDKLKKEVEVTFNPSLKFWNIVKQIANLGGKGVNEKIKKQFVDALHTASGFKETTFVDRTKQIVSTGISNCQKNIDQIFK